MILKATPRWRLLALLCLMLPASLASADSWCAQPVWVHEWGVQTFGQAQRPRAASEPSFFHQNPPSSPTTAAPVRALPADSGIRLLPVLQFFASGTREIPIGIEVGFRFGIASSWFPQVDRRESDPNQTQLFWDNLTLRERPMRAPSSTDLPWVQNLRARESSRWIDGRSESERFVYYEAATRERSALEVSRGRRWDLETKELRIRNVSQSDVHDVLITHLEEGRRFEWQIPRIPAGRRVRLRVNATETTTHPEHALQSWSVPDPFQTAEACVMGRAPSSPTSRAAGHALSRAEVALILELWGDEFFSQQGTSVVYREDESSLHAAMPLALYTDMYHYLILKRLGLAVWRGTL